MKNKGLFLTSITEFSILFLESFFNILQQKISCDDNFLAKTKDTFAKHILVKIEYYEDSDGWGYKRAKIWNSFKNDHVQYFEIEDFDSTKKPLYIWAFYLWAVEGQQEKDNWDSISFVFDSKSNSFFLFISGERFMRQTESFACLNPRSLKAILFKLNPDNFELLERYKYYKDPQEPLYLDESDYYYPTEYYRRYGNLKIPPEEKKDALKEGIQWDLKLYDFTGSRLPKIRRKS